jgi:hypothetical protein
VLTYITRIVTAALALAVLVPSVAFARVNLDSGPAPTIFGHQGQGTIVTATPHVVTVSPGSSFQWDDAAIGAACALALVGVGSAALVVYRRRTGHQTAS